MNLRLILIFYLFFVTFAQQQKFDGCDKVVNVTVDKPFEFLSTNYTAANINMKYAPGSSCRVLLSAPDGYFLQAKGSINLDRKPGVFACAGQSQKFMISREGLLDFYNSELSCVTSTISVNSVYNVMTIGYTSEDDERRAGRFKVTVTALPIDSKTCDCGWGLHSFDNKNGIKGNSFQGFTSVVGIYDEEKDEILCSGAVISQKYIVCAAHCFPDPKSALKQKIYAGYRVYPANEDPYQAVYDIAKVEVHPSYNTTPAHYDVAIIETKTAIKYNRGVSPICLPLAKSFTNEEFYTRSRQFDIVAFEKYKGDGSEQNLSNVVRSSLAFRDCQKFYPKIDGSKNHTCTSFNASAINGEHPGALLIFTGSDRKILIGFYSPTITTLNGLPTVYLKATSVLSWIKEITKNVTMCSRYF